MTTFLVFGIWSVKFMNFKSFQDSCATRSLIVIPATSATQNTFQGFVQMRFYQF